MASAYAAADLVIARSGASTLTEIALSSLPSILVPYPFAADDHQVANAKVFSERGAAKLVLEKDLSAEKLGTLISDLMKSDVELSDMAAAAALLAARDAASRVVAEILK